MRATSRVCGLEAGQARLSVSPVSGKSARRRAPEPLPVELQGQREARGKEIQI